MGLCSSVPSRFSHVQLFVTPWIVAHTAPLSFGFSRQEYCLEWVAVSSSRVSSRPRDRIYISCLLHWQKGSLVLVPPGKAQMDWVSSNTMELWFRRCYSLTLQNGCSLPSSPLHSTAALKYDKAIHFLFPLLSLVQITIISLLRHCNSP